MSAETLNDLPKATQLTVGGAGTRAQGFLIARYLPSPSRGPEVHQVEMGQGGIAMACSLEGKISRKGRCQEAASLIAVSVMDMAALI